jgi:hypothetical protein
MPTVICVGRSDKIGIGFKTGSRVLVILNAPEKDAQTSLN